MAVEITRRDGYLEVRGSGELTPAEWIPAEDLQLPPHTRVLIDYGEVTSIAVPLEVFVHAARVMAEKRLKVAVYATLDVIFGVSRQTIMTAGLPEGEQFAVFRDRDEAISWLIAPLGCSRLD